MARDTESGWQASSGPYCNIVAPYARLEDITPTEHKPACILGTDGSSLTGTIVDLDATNSLVTINVADGFRAYHQVRNVLTYAAAVEATWGQINFGTVVYYDPSATMPAAVKLSLSPLDNTGARNTIFGHVVYAQDEEDTPWDTSRDPFPLGTAGVASTQEDVVVIQQCKSNEA